MITVWMSASAGNALATEDSHFESEGTRYESYLAYEKTNEKKPGILVLPEWWGFNDYVKRRARELAQLGYVALAVDVYGDGELADNPTDAQNLANPYYDDPSKAKSIVEAAVRKLKECPQVDDAQIGAIGYCFGGYLALNAAKLGSNLKAVVSFHGGLTGAVPKKGEVKSKILVCHGADDSFENENVRPFKKQMNEANANYIFKEYPNAVHAFSNPNATERGQKFNLNIRYNEAADKNSWNDMKHFFEEVFE